MENNGDLWEKVLQILKLDPNINTVVYDILLRRVKMHTQEGDTLILSCVDEYSRSLIKGTPTEKRVNKAVEFAFGRELIVHWIVDGDDVSANTMRIVDKKIKSRVPTSSTLTADFTFDNFIVGDCNRFAHASAVAVSNNPGIPSRNPLYLWGNSGLGKTHLMKAIGYSIMERSPEKTVLYTTCEEFTTAFVNCLNNTGYEDFRNKYRNVDVLLIDDIQFLIGKEGTQTEFFNTFETLINNGKQIVITSDKAPKNLTELDQRLTSRFQNGLTMDIQPPDFETRKAIFLSKVKKDGLDIGDDIVNYVCENITKNVRELNGAYNIVNSLYILSNGNLDLETVESHLVSVISPGANKTVTKEMIIDYVSKYYSITPEKLMSTNRSSDIFKARSVAMYLCRDIIDMKFEKIGSTFGGKKHTTVMNACSKVEQDQSLMKDVELIKKRIMDS